MECHKGFQVIGQKWHYITKNFRYLKWRNPHLFKLYGYGLCKGNPISKTAENKVQETLHFRYLKCLVIISLGFSAKSNDEKMISLSCKN